jgi:purine-binding chemotaxis protein CheW
MSDPAQRYMLFVLGGRRFALDLRQTGVMTGLLEEYPVPRAPRFLRGVVNLHGRVVAVLDLGLYLGAGPTREGNSLLQVNLPDCSLALVVDRLERIVHEDEILARHPGPSELERERLELADGMVSLLDAEPLLQAVERVVAS